MHSDAPAAAVTDWGQILQLYDQLLAVAPGPVVAAQPRRRGGRGATARPRRSPWSTGSTWTGTTCTTRSAPTCCGASAGAGEAARAYERALALTGNAAERAYLAARLADQRPE